MNVGDIVCWRSVPRVPNIYKITEIDLRVPGVEYYKITKRIGEENEQPSHLRQRLHGRWYAWYASSKFMPATHGQKLWFSGKGILMRIGVIVSWKVDPREPNVYQVYECPSQATEPCYCRIATRAGTRLSEWYTESEFVPATHQQKLWFSGNVALWFGGNSHEAM
jgi:hypothetical protein